MSRSKLESQVADVRGELRYLEAIVRHQKGRIHDLREHRANIRDDMAAIKYTIARTWRVVDLNSMLPLYVSPQDESALMAVPEEVDAEAEQKALHGLKRAELEDTLTELMSEAEDMQALEEEQENYLEEMGDEVRSMVDDILEIEEAIECSDNMRQLMENMPESYRQEIGY